MTSPKKEWTPADRKRALADGRARCMFWWRSFQCEDPATTRTKADPDPLCDRHAAVTHGPRRPLSALELRP